MNARQLALRRRIMRSFAETGAPPDSSDRQTLRELADRHVVVLGVDGGILMAHPFAARGEAARIDAGGRTWRGNCAWDALGIVAALGLGHATVTANGIAVEVRDGVAQGEALFHVAVPAASWWADIAYT